MKRGRLPALLIVLIALPRLAMADVASTNPVGLGIVHAFLRFCSRVDPRDHESFAAEWQSIVAGAPAKRLDEVEDDGPYKNGYDSTSELLEKVPRREAAAICADAAARWKGTAK